MIAAAYVDTSALVAVVMRQPQSEAVFRALRGLERLVSSDLIISELLSACMREGVAPKKAQTWLERITIVHPALEPEAVLAILQYGYLRGADLHHVASAQWIFGGLENQVCFATLDGRQDAVARKLGFQPLFR